MTPNIRLEELPTWMRPRRRVIDWGLVIMLIFGLFAIFPLISRGNLPRDNAAELYEFRSLQVARLLREGVFYSRWAPDLNYGYGSPLFTFLGPLPHYLSGYHQVFTETGPTNSLRLFLALSMLGAGAGMYLFARARWGTYGGLIAGLAYLYSGPIALALPFHLSDLALLISMALLPWCAWGIDRLWTQPCKTSFWAALLPLVGFFLCDTRVAIFGMLVLMVVTASGRRLPNATAHRQSARYILLAFVLTIGLTAFFWLPALDEMDNIQWIATATEPYAGSIPLTESLSAFPRTDLGMLNTTLYRGIGWASAVFAGLGVVGVFVHRRRTPLGDSGLFLVIGVVLLALTTPLFSRAWPSPYIFQTPQPYHALLVVLFCLCAVGARAAVWFERAPHFGRGLGIAALCLIPLLAAFPALILSDWHGQSTDPDMLTSIRDESQGYHLATLRTGALMPQSVHVVPAPQATFLDSLNRNKLDRVDRQTFSAESQINAVEPRSLATLYVVNAVRPISVRLFLLNYLGWHVSVGEQSIPVESTTEGFMSFSLPIMNGEVLVQFGSTPTRDLSLWLTALSSAALLVITRLPWQRAEIVAPTLTPVPISTLAVLGLLVVAYGGLMLGIRLNSPSTPLLTENTLVETATPFPRFLQGGVDFLAYRLTDSATRVGGELHFSAFWQAARPLVENNQSEIRLLDPATRRVVLRVLHRHPAGIPTVRWALDKYVEDDFTMPIPEGFTPGAYILQVRIGSCTTRDILPCEQIQGMDASDRFGNVEREALTIPEIIRVQ